MKSSNSSVGLVNGSMAVAKAAAKVRNVTRKRRFLGNDARVVVSEQVLSGSQSPFPVGSQFCAGTLSFSAEQLSVSARAWIQSYDRYRIDQVEVFATVIWRSKNGSIDRTAPVTLYFYEDTDSDSSTQTSWIRTSDRDNLGRVVLYATNPTMRLISFKPTASFDTNSVVSQSPSNMIPSKDQWVDANSLAQQHAGFRWFAACAQTDGSGQSYEFDVVLESRLHISVQQPL